ncbi:hypothetical protein SDC9_99002 [bioreactor metagenome]|uniref:Uncharacterized protein n=1 Tax=bioreactor metagenome TaxID=1076179 RepID=A0A645AGB7_9ZZZZ
MRKFGIGRKRPGAAVKKEAVAEHVEPEKSDHELLLELARRSGGQQPLLPEALQRDPDQEHEEGEYYPEHIVGTSRRRRFTGEGAEQDRQPQPAGGDVSAPVVPVGLPVVGDQPDARQRCASGDGGAPQQVLPGFDRNHIAPQYEISSAHRAGKHQRAGANRGGGPVAGAVIEPGKAHGAQIVATPGVGNRISEHAQDDHPADGGGAEQKNQRIAMESRCRRRTGCGGSCHDGKRG